MSRYPSKAWRAFRPGASAPRTLRVPHAADSPDAGDTRDTGDTRVLGLDPGSQRTGFGIIDWIAGRERYVACGCIELRRTADMVARLQRIYSAITALISEHRPQAVAIERVFIHRNPDSALKLGQARGVALCAAAGLGATVHEYAARAIKQAVTGYGGAAKPQVAQMVCSLLRLQSEPQADAADALAVALCHAYRRRLGELGAARVA